MDRAMREPRPMTEPRQPPRYRLLEPGDPAPWFVQRSTSAERYHFDTAAGRWIVMCFLATAGDAAGREALRLAETCADLFDDRFASFFGISLDPEDERLGRLVQRLPGIRHVWDRDAQASRAYGCVPVDPTPGRIEALRRWVLLDPMLRVRRVLPFQGPDAGRAEMERILRALPPPGMQSGIEGHAPVLVLPEVFEPGFCHHLVSLHEAHGGEDSGFMREVDGRTVAVKDYAHKRRSDYLIEDEALMEATRQRVRRRIVPEIRKAHQFLVTRMERYIVACYDGSTNDHFRPHRDNTTRGTAHRRFAVSIALNDGYEGGELVFPEFGPRRYKVGAGTAIVFSCSLLHTVLPVTAGRRYMFLPFLYDDEAARQREANNEFLGEGIGQYSSTPSP